MRMAQVTIYLPDDLRDRAKAAGLNVSALTRQAIQAVLDLPPAPQQPPEVVGVQYEPDPDWQPPTEVHVVATRQQVDCTNPGRPVGAYKVRHVGERKQLGYQTICSACKKAWR